MVWAHVLTMCSAMGNPFEFREMMQAHFHVNTDKSVEQVKAEQEARHKENTPAGRKRRGISEPVAPTTHGTAAPSEMAKMQAMLAAGSQAQGRPEE